MTADPAEAWYRLQEKGVRQAGMALADALRNDPVWNGVLSRPGSSRNGVCLERPSGIACDMGGFAPHLKGWKA